MPALSVISQPATAAMSSSFDPPNLPIHSSALKPDRRFLGSSTWIMQFFRMRCSDTIGTTSLDGSSKAAVLPNIESAIQAAGVLATHLRKADIRLGSRRLLQQGSAWRQSANICSTNASIGRSVQNSLPRQSMPIPGLPNLELLMTPKVVSSHQDKKWARSILIMRGRGSTSSILMTKDNCQKQFAEKTETCLESYCVVVRVTGNETASCRLGARRRPRRLDNQFVILKTEGPEVKDPGRRWIVSCLSAHSNICK